MSDNQNDPTGPQDEEPSTQSNQEEIGSTTEESSNSNKWEPEPVKFIATEATKDYVVIVTNYWRAKWCEGKDCDEEGEYGHPVYEPNIKSREYVRRIRLDFCKDKQCKDANRVHTHQGNDKNSTEVEVPESMAEIIWQDSLSMIVEHIGLVDIIRDEREEHEYIYEAFDCDDANCSIFFTRYRHLFNVDPDYLKIRITPILIKEMVKKGMVCDKQECE